MKKIITIISALTVLGVWQKTQAQTTSELTFSVTQPAPPTNIAVTTANSTCGNANGSLNIGAVTGGTTPFTYSVNPVSGSFSSTTSYGSLNAGTYSVSVKDNNGCTFTKTSTVANTPGPTALAVATTNSTCGNANGVITIGAVTGGISPFTYSVVSLSAGYTSTTSYTNAAATTYTVNVKDANGCVFSRTVAVSNTSGPTSIVTNTTAATCGNNNGSLTLGAVTGGVGPYTFSVSTVSASFASTTSFPNLVGGTYSITVKDANSCTYSVTTTVSNTSGPTAVATTTTAATCGNNNGSLTLGAVTGGVAPYTYSVSSVSASFGSATSFPNLAGGTYTITVKDVNNCTYLVTTNVTNSGGPSNVSLSSTNSTCGNANGAITIGAVTGGTSPFTYSVVSLSAGYTSSTSYTNAAATTYSVNVKDANGCVFTKTVAVSNTAGPSALNVNTNNATCGSSNGSLTIGATTGGSTPFTYSFNGGAYSSTTSYTNLAASIYTVSVKDANSCTYTVTATVVNTAGPSALTVNTTNATCGNANGALTIGTVTGGTSPFTYSVSPISSSFGTTTNYSNLAGGNYTVTVRDANTCTYSVTTTINSTNNGPSALDLSSTSTTCGNSNGTITINNVTGGSAPYTYSLNGGVTTPTTTYTNLFSGSYTVTVKDANNCTFATNTSISNTSGPSAISSTTTNSTCGNANGSIVLGSVTGGTAPFLYSLNGGAYASLSTYSNLAAASYTISVKDANDCVYSTTTNITTTNPPTDVAISTSNPGCGSSNGVIALGAVTGGTSPYSYSFNNGAFSSNTLFLNLASGNYSIQVKDANNCIFSTSATLTAPPAVDPTFNTISPICSGATLSPLPTTSTNNITGTWSPAVNNQASTTYTFTPTTGQCANSTQLTIVVNQLQLMASSSVNDCGNNSGFIRVDSVIGGVAPFMYQLGNGSPQSTNFFSNLQGGNYLVSATDNNGCTADAFMNIASAQAIAINFTTINADCAPFQNATLTANASGGSWPYQFTWLGTSNTSASINNLQSGTYTCYVSDIYSCSAMQSITITEPSPLNVSITSTNTECGLSTGSATATVSGGTIPYIYQWSSGSQQAQANELTSGQYAVQIYDANGCNTSGIANINTGNGPVVNLLSIQHATCYGAQDGGLSVNVTGGVPPYTINWNSGQTTTELTNVPGGYYDIVVTDVTNCQTVQSFEIMQPAPYTFNFTYQEPPCGSSTGSISAQVTGGVAPYVYQWSSNANDQTTPIASNLAADIYTLSVTDANNCAYYEITNLSNANNNVQIQVDNVQRASCGAVSTGSINITPTGGVAPYTYRWSNGATTEDISSLSPGGYYVNTTDATGCRAGRYVEVQSNSIDYQPEICLVTVDTALSRNQIIWEKTVQQGIKSFKIYREFSTNNYQAIAEVPFAQQSMYTDVNANPAVRSFRYKISAVDSCDVETPLSSKHKTIHLVQFPALGGSNSLIWDFYDGYSYDYFFIWRDDPSTGWMKIDSMPSNLTSYTDITPPSIDARYMIEIVPPSPCVSTMKNGNPTNDLFTTVVKSKSNIRNNRQNTVAVKNQSLNNNDLKVYPNPATHSITIELFNFQPSNLQPTITIENMLGQLLYQSKINQNKSSINISNFQPGVYLLKVLTEKGLMVKSIVVER